MKTIQLMIIPMVAPFLVIAQQISPGSVVINEILFNPVKDGYDYLEIFNKSKDTLDLELLYIANRNVTGDVNAKRAMARGPTLLPPSSYAVLTANSKWLRQTYTISNDAIISELSALPSFLDDEGDAIILDSFDHVIDELKYEDSWHLALIADPAGVALERINYDAATQDKNNWISASSASGYGTPGMRNSHFRSPSLEDKEIVVSPKIFTPDNDGVDDFGLIEINANEPGYIARIAIFDGAGRLIKTLVKNDLLGSKVVYRWDGLDDRQVRAPAGLYIVAVELFNMNGKIRRSRQVLILKR